MTAMSMTAPEHGVPCSGLEWRRWAREQVERLELSPGEANVLRLLADRANARGAVTLGIAIFVRQLRLSESQVYRLLGALKQRGLLRTTSRGRGRVPLRELVAEPAERQLSLFDDVGCGLAAAPADPPAHVSAAAASPAVQAAADTGGPTPAAVPVAEPCPRIDARMPSHQCDPAVEGAATATEEEDARERSRTESGLSPSLAPVLDVLHDAPGLYVVDAAVNAALLSFPHADHLQAAHRVASWAHEGGLNAGAANRLLWRALERQAAAGQRADRCDDGRRRRRAPETSEARVPGHGPEAVAALREMRLAMAAARGEVQS